MKFEFEELFQNLIINGTAKPIWYKSTGYALEVKGTKFFNPLGCHYSFLLGQGNDNYKTCIGDKRYKLIEKWLEDNIIPKIKRRGNRTISSYVIKHICERAIGGYVSNETVKFILCMHKMPTAKVREEYPINLRYFVISDIDI